MQFMPPPNSKISVTMGVSMSPGRQEAAVDQHLRINLVLRVLHRTGDQVPGRFDKPRIERAEAAVSAADRKRIAHGNAERLFNL
jgi:hypothetical protein